MINKKDRSKKSDKEKVRRGKLQRIEHVVEEARQEWKDDPNVIGLGFGSKHRGGKVTDEIAITFLVRHKVGSEDGIRALGSKPIPREYKGFPTDVIQVKMTRASDMTGERDEKRFDPLVGGVATSNAEQNIVWFNGAGTLGTLCFKDDIPMALSNWHVWADGGDKGDDIIQPGHPRGREHLEGLGKVAFCGPLLGSLFEWEAPSPLTWGLYGGAAATAIAAAASDEVDPIRHGQEATPTDPGERTLSEQVNMEISYVEQPIPGTPYKLEVAWEYQRTTNRTVRVHSIKETKTNPHVLLFKQLWSDRVKYRPGSRVRLFARIASFHPRPCDSYYVVAHYIPDRDPSRLLSTVLSPISCDIVDKVEPPEDKGRVLTCVDFSHEKPSTLLNSTIQRERVRFEVPSGEQNRIVDFTRDTNGELFLHNQLIVSVPLCTRVEAAIFFNNPLLTMEAYHAGKLMGSARVSKPTGRVVNLIIEADTIDRVVFKSGQWECSLLKFCYTPAKVRRVCCYTGEMTIPSNEKASTWKGYLIVQNINDVPERTSPEKAAETIGGIIISQNFIAQVLGCGAIMVADHHFDVI
jgi:hypothetical protein